MLRSIYLLQTQCWDLSTFFEQSVLIFILPKCLMLRSLYFIQTKCWYLYTFFTQSVEICIIYSNKVLISVYLLWYLSTCFKQSVEISLLWSNNFFRSVYFLQTKCCDLYTPVKQNLYTFFEQSVENCLPYSVTSLLTF